MTSSITREWVGFNTFAPATQTKLLELLGRLKEENVNKLTILVMGKCGVGKSSTVNSLTGERAVTINPFQSEGLRPSMVSRSRMGFTLNVIDTPGLIEGGYINNQALEIIKHFLLDKTIDILLYVDRMDTYRVDNLDKMASSNRFFLAKNDDTLVLPNGIAWIPNLVNTITEVALNGCESIYVDKKLIDGSSPNQRGKSFIPLIFALQYLFARKSIERAIKNDVARETKPSWAMRDAKSKF